MQTQSDSRVKKRIHCTLEHDARQGSGLILNYSRGGLFVQTAQPAAPGARVVIDFIDPAHSRPIELETSVVWRRRISPLMTGLNQSGMGLRLLDEPPAYRALVDTTLHPVLKGAIPRDDPPRVSGSMYEFVVRLGHSGGPRTRRIKLRAADTNTAQRDALRRAGAGWEVIEVSRSGGEPGT